MRYLYITTEKRVDFASVIYPCRTSEWTEKPEFSVVQTPSATLARGSGGTVSDHLIRHDDTADTAQINGYVFDGKAASVGKGANGGIRDIFLAEGTIISDKDGARVLLQAKGTVGALHAVMTDSAITVFIDQIGNIDLRLYAPGSDPANVVVPGWSVSVTADGDYLVLAGSSHIGAYRDIGQRNHADVLPHGHAGKVIRFLPDATGIMTVSIYRLDGKRLWISAPVSVRKGSPITVPVNRPMRNSTLILVLDIDGKKTAELLPRLK